MSDSRRTLLLFAVLFGCACPRTFAEPPPKTAAMMEIRSLSANGQPVPLRAEKKLRLSASAKNVTLIFSPAMNNPRAPLRVRYKLDGYDEDWREPFGEMSLAIRFVDATQEQVGERTFLSTGQSDGWTGNLETSAFTHREETLTVPAGAKSVWLVISSAGPPNAVGVFAISNLALTKLPAGPALPVPLLSWGTDAKGEISGNEWIPSDWVRNGLRPGMAKVMPVGPGGIKRALVLFDDDPSAHAEWTTRKEAGPLVTPGERLLLVWDEARSIGLAGPAQAIYSELPAGFYRFRMNELSLAGVPGEAEASMAFEVPLSFWRTPWFWGLLALLSLSGAVGAYRYAAARQMRRQLARLESQRALEHERLRIARDIHDDLGARVTQMSLVSGLAQSDPTLSDKARADFNAISGMSRELVSALYETVWAVNPENDNLDELGNYLCQMVDNLCERAQLRRRLRVAELPRDIQISSHVRHELVMAVKEAVHNVIKHAHASEVSVAVTLEGGTLTIRVQDDGRGFEPGEAPLGNGLGNMERRLQHVGGTCALQTRPGQGTTVWFRAPMNNAS